MRPTTPRERAAARLVTGPWGHLAAGAADFAVLFWRYWRGRLGSGPDARA